ncbi:ribonuclease H-like domain-containing protein [Tanacetum coccineum]
MMGIPNEHQLKFNSIKDAKKLLEAVEKRFGGNAATKKTQRNLLKQQYENFTTPSSEMLDQTFDRLQKLVSQLELLDENISQEDVNKKCLTKTLKGVNEPGSKGMSSSSSNTQNMDFVSSSNNNTSNTNEAVNTAHEVSTTSTQVNAANSTNIDNLSDAVICTLLLGQHIGPQLVHEDLQQIHPDDMKLTVNSNKTIGFDKSKVECYNCHKMGHFAREYRAPSNQDKQVTREEKLKNEMAYGNIYFHSFGFIPDSEVSNDSICSKSCLETVQLLKDLKKSELMVLGEMTIRELRKKLEIVQKEKDDIQLNVCFRKKAKLAPRFVGSFEIIEKVGPVAYRLDLPEELNGVHNRFHVSNLKECLVNPILQVPLDEIRVDTKLNFVEEPVEILEREFKKLKHSRITIVKLQ